MQPCFNSTNQIPEAIQICRDCADHRQCNNYHQKMREIRMDIAAKWKILESKI